jgi:hypothetical protein
MLAMAAGSGLIRDARATQQSTPAAGTRPSSGQALAGSGHLVALLLPLSGSQRAVAEAVRDGFLAAHYAARDSGPRPEILVIDEERPGPAQAYQAAIAAGASQLVGPLMKDSVTKVAAVAGSTRVLALNNLEANAATPAQFYQFSLAPEDETQQVAERASAAGQRRAVALLPDNELGRRLRMVFSAAVEGLGGTVVGTGLYDPAGTNFTDVIQRLLLLDESRARHRALVANLGQSLEFEPTRRPDVDYIFLVASTASGRLIRPQLRFLYAGDLPTYATSAIYQPGSGSEDDMEGIMFVDAPIVIAPDDQSATLRAALAERWPAGAMQRIRFYAMGVDAYRLVSFLAQDSSTELAGLTGLLRRDRQNRIHRQLSWAQIRDGRAQPLRDTTPEVSAVPGPR